MAKIQISVEVSKETNDVGVAAANLIGKIKEKSEGGLTAAEIVQVLTEEVGDLMTAFEGSQLIGAELSESPEAFAMASAVAGGKILGVFLKKPVAPPIS